MVEKATDAIFIGHLQGDQTYGNRACYELFGYDHESHEMDGMPLVNFWPKEDIPILARQVLPQAMAGRWSGEVWQKRKDGTLFNAHLTVFPVPDETGQPTSIAFIIRDTSERKAWEREREKMRKHHVRQAQLIAEVSQEIAAATTLDELFHRVVTLIKERFGYYHAQILRHDPQQNLMVVTAGYGQVGEKMTAAGYSVDYGTGVAGTAAATHQPVLIPDVSQDHHWVPYPDLPDTQGELAVPIRLRDQVLAVLDVHSDVTGALNEEDQVMLMGLVGQIATLEITQPFEQPQDTPEKIGPALQPHAREPQAESESPQAATSDEHSQPAIGLFRTIWLKIRQQGHRSRRWGMRQMAVAGVLLLTGSLIGWTVGILVRGEPPTVAAQVFSSPRPHATLTTNVPVPPATPSPTPRPTHTAMPSPTPRPTRTPSPMVTSSPTLSPTPTFTPSPIPLIVPSPFPASDPNITSTTSSTMPIPTPVQPVPVAADAVNIVVLGSDRRPDWSEWHTDAVHVVSIQRDGGAISVISIPRDLYLYIPGFWMSRINFADFYGESYDYEGGGPALVRDTLLYNLGIRADYYVRTNFDGLIGIVDTMEGVDIPVHCYLSDYWPYPDENGEYPILAMEPGMHHMDGETALWYSRSRKTTSVFSRERRQQQVLQALWHKARDTSGMLSRIPALWSQGRDMVVTDMTLADILDMAHVALTLKDQNVRFYNIGAGAVTPWTTPYGGNVFLPRWDKIQPIVTEAMAPVPEARIGRVYTPVQVWNGTPNKDWDMLAADRLRRVGFAAVIGEPDQQDYAETQLIVFGRQAKGTGVGYIQQMFGLPDNMVTYQPDGHSEFGFRLILGADYQTCP
ncbi:MAG: LCP family protein [Chloroflexota bacterium]|nr:LCP family protein [Chloroflexota bacterium]